MENRSVQNPVPEPVLTPVQVPEPKAKFPVMYLVLSLLILVFLTATAFLYYQNMQLKNMLASYQNSTSPTPTTYQSPVPTTDTTVNWKTYINKTYGISFNYPKEAKIIGDIESQLFTIVSGSQPVSFLASENSQGYSVNEFMLRTISPNNPDSVRKYVTFSNVSFNNLNFVLANQDANYFSQQSGSLNSYLIGKGNYVFSFGFNKVSESLITQILSTFKFTK